MRLTDEMLPEAKKTFLYFAYGSNLLTERIRINNPSAQKISIGKVNGYRLDFNLYGKSWHGATATIAKDVDRHVWGVIWEINMTDLENLDRQEYGYDPITLQVQTTDGKQLECRSYVITSAMQGDRRPSTIYKTVIVRGAEENELPSEYIQELNGIEDNGYTGPVGIELSNETLRNG